MTNVGIVGVGTYLPKKIMTAKEISEATGGVWSEDAVRNKLGINQKYMPSSDPCDGTQEMGALAALKCLENTGVDPLEIDVILCITEEWKEYPLTTSACYVQDRIGAKNAWGIDVQNRCCTAVSAMKLAKDILIADDEVNTVLVCGGYRNCDFLDYTDSGVSFMFNLGAGGGAILLKKNYNKNLLLGTHLMSDGSVVHTCGSKVGGILEPVTPENYKEFGMLRLMDSPKMKGLLNTVSMPNWYHCIDEALRKSGKTREDIDYLSILQAQSAISARSVQKRLSVSRNSFSRTTVASSDSWIGSSLQSTSSRLRISLVYSVLVASGIGSVWKERTPREDLGMA